MKLEPVAWMFRNKKNGNTVFFERALDAEKFAQYNPDWEMTPLYTQENA